MKRAIVFCAFALVSSVALAGNCPWLMSAIDTALPNAKLNAAQTAEVKKLRADGERLHKEGKHAESMAALNKAKGILNLK